MPDNTDNNLITQYQEPSIEEKITALSNAYDEYVKELNKIYDNFNNRMVEIRKEKDKKRLEEIN